MRKLYFTYFTLLKFSWGSSARALKTLSRLRRKKNANLQPSSQTHGLNCIPHARPEVKGMCFISVLNVITTTIMSSHIQKLPSLGVARKI